MKGLTELADRVKAAFVALLENPHPTIPVDQGDVITGNVSRIADLFDRVLSASAADDGLAAEIFLRSLTDSVIQLRWLLSKNDNANSRSSRSTRLRRSETRWNASFASSRRRACPKRKRGR
jgi:hypothetical protein